MKVSVIIVSYNAKIYLEQCLSSVEAALKNTDGEIIVVDNASPEKTVDFVRDKFPNVQFIESKENLGFAKANNLGVEKARGEYVLILNPDTLIPENLFTELIPYAESVKDMGALGVRLIDANGKFHPESKRNIPSIQNTFGKLFAGLVDKKKTKGYYKTDVGEFEIAPCEVLVGAFMLLKKEVYQNARGFDERYFMYGEDIDLSYSLIRKGYTNYYYGKISVLHYKGESTRKDKKYLKIFFGAMGIFIRKYYKDNLLKYLILIMGIKLRYIWAQITWLWRSEEKNTEFQLDMNQLETIQNESDIKEKSVRILLDGTLFSHQEIIEIISNHQSPGREFFISPINMHVIIGDKGMIIDN